MALAEVLDRRVDVVEVGFDAGTRAAAAPGVAGGARQPRPGGRRRARRWRHLDPDDSVVDRVGLWSTWGADRHRLRDRLRELRLAPWADATGDGVTLRMAAARAALGRLEEWTPEWNDRPPADLVVATGGAWAVAPAPAVALALVDVLRRAGRRPVRPRPRPDPRPARVDPGRGRAAGDDRRPGRRPPRAARHAWSPRPACTRAGVPARWSSTGPTARPRLDLDARAVSRWSTCRPGPRRSPSSSSATRSGSAARGRHFAIDVTGGLGGLVVDLRDVPLRLPIARTCAASCSSRGRRPIVTGRRDVSARRRPARLGPAADRVAGRRRLRARTGRPAARVGRRFGRASGPRSPSACAIPGSTRWRSRRRSCRSPAGGGSACPDAATSRGRAASTSSTGTAAGGSRPATWPTPVEIAVRRDRP